MSLQNFVTRGVPFVGGGVSLLNLLRSLVDENGGVYWPFQEPSGAVADALNPALAEGRDVIINGDFATDTIWTKGANWTISGGNATHAAGATADLSQNNIIGAARTYELTFTVSGRTAGTITPKLGTTAGTARSTNATFVETIASNGTDLVFTPTSDFDGNIDDVILTQQNIPANDSNLDASHTGVTVGQSATSALGLAVGYDGLNDYTDGYSIELNSSFDPIKGTFLCFAQVNDASVWTDGVDRRIIKWSDSAPSDNLTIRKATGNNTFDFFYITNVGNVVTVQHTPFNPTDYFLLAMTWDTVADEFKAYINDAQVGTTQSGFVPWATNFGPADVTIGAKDNIPSNVWDGTLTHQLLLRETLSLQTIAQIARAGGVA